MQVCVHEDDVACIVVDEAFDEAVCDPAQCTTIGESFPGGGNEVCCPTGQTKYGDGSACQGDGKPQCKLYGNPSKPLCSTVNADGSAQCSLAPTPTPTEDAEAFTDYSSTVTPAEGYERSDTGLIKDELFSATGVSQQYGPYIRSDVIIDISDWGLKDGDYFTIATWNPPDERVPGGIQTERNGQWVAESSKVIGNVGDYTQNSAVFTVQYKDDGGVATKIKQPGTQDMPAYFYIGVGEHALLVNDQPVIDGVPIHPVAQPGPSPPSPVPKADTENGEAEHVQVAVTGYNPVPATSDPILCGSGVMVGSQSDAHGVTGDCAARDECMIDVNAACQVRVCLKDRCASKNTGDCHGSHPWSDYTSTSASSGPCGVTVSQAEASAQHFVLPNTPIDAITLAAATINKEQWPADFCINLDVTGPATVSGSPDFGLIGGRHDVCEGIYLYLRSPSKIGFGVQCNAGGSDSGIDVSDSLYTDGTRHVIMFCYDVSTKQARIAVDGKQAAAGQKDFKFDRSGEISIFSGLHNREQETMPGATLHALSISHMSCGIDKDTCESNAQAAGLAMGGGGHPFVGDYSTKGCYAYSSGQYAGMAYYSQVDGGDVQSESDLNDVGTGDKYRVVGTYGCEATGNWMDGLCRNKNTDGAWDSSVYGAYCHAPTGQTPETCKDLCLGYPSCMAAGGYGASCDLFTAETTGTPTDCPDGTTATAASGTSPDPSVYVGQEYLTYTAPSSRCFIKATTAEAEHVGIESGSTYRILSKHGCPDSDWCNAELSWDGKASHPMASLEHHDPVGWKLAAVSGEADTYKVLNQHDCPDHEWCNAELSWDKSAGMSHPMASVEHHDPVGWKFVAVDGKVNTYTILNQHDCPDHEWCNAELSWDTGTGAHPMVSIEKDDPCEWEIQKIPDL